MYQVYMQIKIWLLNLIFLGFKIYKINLGDI